MDREARAALAVAFAGVVIAGPALAQTDQPKAKQFEAGQPSSAAATGGTPAAPAAKPSPSKYLTQGGQIETAALIGTAIYNDQNQQIGTISDILLDKSNKAVTAVLSVGGFLGVGSRLVAVSFAALQIEPNKVTMPGATKVSLENLPAYSPDHG